MDINPFGRLLGDALTVPLRIGQKVAGPAIDIAESVAGHLPDLHFGPDEDDHHQVVYDFFSGIEPELKHPGGSLPGANLWDQQPSATHPVPVVLVHGTGGGAQSNWGTYVPLLVDEGFSVFSLTYGAIPGTKWPMSAIGGMTLIEDSAAEFGAFVEKVLEATGAPQVDVVGHSQGTIVPNYWAKFLGGKGKIGKYVSLAPLWNGTEAFGHTHDILHFLNIRFGIDPAKVLPCYSAVEMIKGSEFLQKLNSDGGPYLPGIQYTNISTTHDEFVRPYTSGQLPGPPGTDVTNIVVQDQCRTDFSDHLGICGSQRAAGFVLNALDDNARHEVPCYVVTPFFGSGPLGSAGGAPALVEPFAVGMGATRKGEPGEGAVGVGAVREAGKAAELPREDMAATSEEEHPEGLDASEAPQVPGPEV